MGKSRNGNILSMCHANSVYVFRVVVVTKTGRSCVLRGITCLCVFYEWWLEWRQTTLRNRVFLQFLVCLIVCFVSCGFDGKKYSCSVSCTCVWMCVAILWTKCSCSLLTVYVSLCFISYSCVVDKILLSIFVCL